LDYELVFDTNAEKFLKKLSKKDGKTAKILLNAIKEILRNPYNSKSLKGIFRGYRRIRKDPYRIIFIINKKSNEIRILEIERRNKAYKKK
jgi:mRNA interferase RelE/StbE